MTAPQLTRDESKQALAVLSAAYDRIATAMFGLDSHAGLRFLRGSGLAGATAQVAEHVKVLMSQLWAQFSALSQHLERARATDDLPELTRLLREPVVALDGDGFPVDLTGGGATAGAGAVARTVTLTGLAQSLETTTTELADLLTEVDTAVSTVANRLAEVSDALGKLRADPATAGEVDLDQFETTLAELRDLALADPVELARPDTSPTEQRLDRLAADLTAAAERQARIAELRDHHPQRIAELTEAVDRVAAAEQAATESYRVVREKIADPGLPAVPAAAADLRRRLASADALARADRWGRLADELAAIGTAAGEARAYAERLRRAADGLLDRRTELRGRLSAYRAKAARSGFGEHPELSERHREAYDLLYTSPCDLPAATRAVFRYQQTLANLIDREETGS